VDPVNDRNDRNGEPKVEALIERTLRSVRAEADPAVLQRALRRLEAPAPANAFASWLLRPAAAWAAAAMLVVSVSVSYGVLRASGDRALAPTQVVDSLLEDDSSFDLLPEEDATTADSGSVS
jgi:hypothetical protein